MTAGLNRVDLCFVIDTTASMSSFIQAAQQQLLNAIAQATGGQSATANSANDVINKITAVLKDEFQNLEFDQQVLKTVQQIGYLDISDAATALDLPRLPVATAVARLGKRGFL